MDKRRIYVDIGGATISVVVDVSLGWDSCAKRATVEGDLPRDIEFTRKKLKLVIEKIVQSVVDNELSSTGPYGYVGYRHQKPGNSSLTITIIAAQDEEAYKAYQKAKRLTRLK